MEGKFKNEAHRAVVSIRLTSNLIGLVHEKIMKQFDLTMAQFNILRILRGASEPLTISTVKQRMIEKSPNTTRLLDKLLDKRYIQRFQCEKDKRQTYLQISKDGLDILKEIDALGDFPADFTAQITEEELFQMNQTLKRIHQQYLDLLNKSECDSRS